MKAMAIDVETTRPILANKLGGLSGPAVKPVVLRHVYDVYEHVKVPIAACGGVTTWRDAAEFMLAGASAVQVGTAVATEGKGVFKSIEHGLRSYLKRKGFTDTGEIVGLSHRS
jgi:dihydroorotate dehydrogenase (NAD+) catalytic subunit